MYTYYTLVALIVHIIHVTVCTNVKINFREKEKEVLDQILGQGMYDARIRPSGVNGTGERISWLAVSIMSRSDVQRTGPLSFVAFACCTYM
jgi:anionic glutamate receptor